MRSKDDYLPLIRQAEKEIIAGRASLAQMAKHFQIKYHTFYRVFKKYSDVGVTITNNGKQPLVIEARRKSRKIPEINDVQNMYAAGSTLQDIANKYQTSAATVLHYMRKHGIARRSKREIMKQRMSVPEVRENLRRKSTASYLQRKTDTKPEREFKKWLNSRGIFYLHQYRIGARGHPYDFYFPDYNLIVEIDGHYWHQKVEQKVKDKLHVDLALKAGYDIVRIDTKDLKNRDGDYLFWLPMFH